MFISFHQLEKLIHTHRDDGEELQMPAAVELGQVIAGNWRLYSGPARGWQGPKHLKHHLMSPTIQQQETGSETATTTGSGTPVWAMGTPSCGLTIAHHPSNIFVVRVSRALAKPAILERSTPSLRMWGSGCIDQCLGSVLT